MISLFGLFLALGFLIGAFVFWYKAKEEAYDEEKIFDGIIITLFSALLGARLEFIFLNFQDFGFNLLKWFWLTRYTGLRFEGALLFGILGFYLFCRRLKWDFWLSADLAVFGLCWVQAIVKIGCFFNEKDITQIYESLLLFLIFFVLGRLERSYRLFAWYKGKKDRAAPGFLFLSYLIIFFTARMFLEKIRGNSLFLNGVIALISLGFLYWRSGRELPVDIRLLISYCCSAVNRLKYRLATLKRKKITTKKKIKVGKDIHD